MVRMEQWRLYDRLEPWLLMIDTGLGRGPHRFLFARAVVDDFGNLVIVQGWM